MAITLFLTLFASPTSTQAVEGFDSQYFGESAFLSLSPGQSGQFAVAFTNRGATGWHVGTASQVNLAICLSDKTTCNVPSQYSSWAVAWYSSTAYATTSTSFVGPGQIGWFIYSVRPPTGTPAGITARFNGDVVLASTGERLRPEGYYQDAAVGAPTATPTQMTVSPSYQTAKLGSFPAVVATVTADPASGSSTRVPVANLAVVFEVTSSSALNGPMSLSAVTNVNGQASITYTRNNPGTDTVSAHVAEAPTVRGVVTIVWNLTGASISLGPDDAVTRANDGSGCRTYSYTATNPSNGSPLTNTTLQVNFLENINRTSDQDGGATIVGDATASPTPTSSVAETTDSAGQGTFNVCGNGAVVSVTPMLFDNSGGGNPSLLESGDNADAGGKVTFQTRQATVTISPVADGTRVIGGQRAYQITAVDQFLAAYTGAVWISLAAVQDGNASTSSTAYLAWVDNDLSLTMTEDSAGNAPLGTTDTPDVQTYQLSGLNSSGQASFAFFAPINTSAQPVVWVDSNGNGALDAVEAQGTGGTTTWESAALSACTLTKSKQLAPTSTGAANAGLLGDGDVFFVFTFRDQNGVAVSPSPAVPVTFQVANTGSAIVAARTEAQSSDTVVPGGTSQSLTTPNPIGDPDAYMVLDAGSATSASVTASATVSGRLITCGPTTIRWVSASPEPTSGSLSGTVTSVERGQGASDGGGYVLHTLAGDYVITYAPSGNTFIVAGAAATEAQFEAALSVNDVALWSHNSGAESHNITTNN